MAKGLAQRRRLKRALDAARGNLHKIANGKALPSELPEAPKTQETEKLPASLRKMLALKEVAEKQGKKARSPGPGAAQPQAQGRKAISAAQQADDGDGPSTSGRKEPGQDQRQAAADKGGTGKVKGGNAFLTEQFVQKKLKDKKKQYLKLKQEKKRHKGAGSEIVVEKELQLRDNVKFGEVVDAPLDVHLKRKHWVDQERTANQRCKEVFLKQMQQAQQRLAGATHDEGIALLGARRKQAGGSGAAAAGGAGRGAQGTKRKAPMDLEAEQLRQQVIESYRATKKTAGIHNAAVGNATMASLAHLVGKASGSKAAAAKTHTLA